MNDALYTLKKYWGYDHFRQAQEEIINAVLDGNDVLAMLPTGGGKSITFQVPAMMKEGICVVISPLVALITDQVTALKNKEIRAISLAGGLSYRELERLLNNALYGQYKFIYLSPERLQQNIVRTFLKVMKINLLVIDEAHCVSHWGKDFRPAYLHCQWLKEQFPEVPMLALTASATPKVQQDIMKLLLIEKAKVIKTSLIRPNIAYRVEKENNKWHRLLQLLNNTDESAIIYLRSRNGCVQLAELLSEKGITTTYYHGGLLVEEKTKKLNMWLQNDVRVMVATNAFGMGIDKPDVRLVIHWDIPQTLEDYFQEAGRAGRDGKAAEAVLLYNTIDIENSKKLLTEYLIDIPYLKHVYHKLNSYFQIAIGEITEETYSFMFFDFCKHYQLSSIKTYNALQVLDRFSIISISQQFYNKVTLQLRVINEQLVKYLSKYHLIKKLVIYLIRTHALIYEQPVELDIPKITELTEIPYYELMKYLEKLHQDGVAILKSNDADIQIVFNVPRDDDRTINSIAKNIKEYNENKKRLQQLVYHYLKDESTCRNIQLLQYFGEHTHQTCGICSNCLVYQIIPKIDLEIVREAILKLLQKKGKVPVKHFYRQLPYPHQILDKALKELFYMRKIILTDSNELAIK